MLSRPLSALLLGVVLDTLLFPLATGEVHADPMVVYMDSSQRVKDIQVKVNRRVTTVLVFPDPVQEAFGDPSSGFILKPAGRTVGVLMKRNARRGNAIIRTDKWEIGAAFEAVDDPQDAVMQVVFRDMDSRFSLGRDLFYRSAMAPESASVEGDGPIRVEVDRCRLVHRDVYCQLAAHNAGPEPLRLDAHSVASFVGGVRVAGARLQLGAGEEAHALVAPGEPVQGVLCLSEIGELWQPLTIGLRDATGDHESRVTVTKWRAVAPEAPMSATDVDRLFLDQVRGADHVEGPIDDLWERGHDALKVRVALIAYRADDGLISFEVTNGGAFPFALARVAVQDPRGGDHTKLVRVDGRDEVAGEIAPGESLRVSALFDDPLTLERRGLMLALTPQSGAPAAINVLEARLEARRRHINKGRKSVLLSGSGGVLRMDRGDEASAHVGAWGLGGQLVYGAGANWSADIGLSGLVSGEAELAGATRSERLYRLHGGARYQFGEDGWIPFARVGAGVALVTKQEDGDRSFDSRISGQVGGGVTRWLGDALVLGAEMLLDFGWGERSYSITAGAHLGFAWDGNEF